MNLKQDFKKKTKCPPGSKSRDKFRIRIEEIRIPGVAGFRPLLGVVEKGAGLPGVADGPPGGGSTPLA